MRYILFITAVSICALLIQYALLALTPLSLGARIVCGMAATVVLGAMFVLALYGWGES